MTLSKFPQHTIYLSVYNYHLLLSQLLLSPSRTMFNDDAFIFNFCFSFWQWSLAYGPSASVPNLGVRGHTRITWAYRAQCLQVCHMRPLLQIVQYTKMRLCHIVTMVLVSLQCSKFLGIKVQMGHLDHFIKSWKILVSYRHYNSKLKLRHIGTLGLVPSGCSGLYGSMSKMGHVGHFM